MNRTPHIYRVASKGKPFTRNERINIIRAGEVRRSRSAQLQEFVMEQKNQIAKEREAREKAAKKRNALLSNPTLKPSHIKTRKDGSMYFQLRTGGKLSAAVTI